MKTPVCMSVLLFAVVTLHAQVVSQPAAPQAAAPPAAAAPASGQPASKPQTSFLGKDVPVFDPGTNIVTMDGKSWNVTNNELFQARFEKYLSAPEETSDKDKAYQAIIVRILDDLAPGNQSQKTVDDAFSLLPQASSYDIDARLCDTLADAVYSAWRAQNQAARLDQANAALEEEQKKHEWNIDMLTRESSLGAPPTGNNRAATNAYTKDADAARDAKLSPELQRVIELKAIIKKNQAAQELDKAEAKIEFQALIVQFFMQRRFQHVLMATRFYRAVFNDGDEKLHSTGKQTDSIFANTTGMPPTVATIDSLANEAIRDVREGVDAFEFLLRNDQLEGASKRLAEAFTVGEYMPEVRTIPRSEKQQALKFVHQQYQLISAINVKDYARAGDIVKDLEVTAKDFDNSQPLAAIETAETVADLHIEKANNAMASGDKATVEKELTAAMETWPRDPKLKDFIAVTDKLQNPMQQALLDFDRLLSEHNDRQIYDDRMRFIAAVALDPKRAEQLKQVLDQMQKIETALAEANIRSKSGDFPGAWEGIEAAYRDFPDDSKLNDMRATLTTEAPEFVHTLRSAEEYEQKDEVGSSLAWYLKAQRIYPGSEFAHAGIDRLSKKIIPAQPEG